MDAVEIEKMSFSYPKKRVLAGISVRIKKGEFVGLLGKTGCGKSTLLLTLNGIIPQMIPGEFSGSVKILGNDSRETPVHHLAHHVAFVFQDPDEQIFSLKVNEEILFGLSNIGITGKEAEERVVRSLKTVGLSEYSDSDPHDLSHGQKQKLAFACALAVDPEVYVLDEPVSSLDYSSSEEIYSLLNRLNKSGKTVIVAEHDTEWLAEHASRILFLNDGRIEADGGPELLFDERIRKVGVKVPCAVQLSEELGFSSLTPRELAKKLKSKTRK